MFTHIMLGTNNVAHTKRFYDAALAPLGIAPGLDLGDRVIYRSATGTLGLLTPRNGEPATFANGGTTGLAAADKQAVDSFYAHGLAAGGTCEGAPGVRPDAPGNAYGAYLRDPDGNKICAFCQLPAQA